MFSFRFRRTVPVLLTAALLGAIGFGAAPVAARAADSHPIGSWEKYPWSSTLYKVGTPYSATAQTWSQWQAAGFPQHQVKLVLGSSVYAFATHRDDIFIGPMTSDNHPRFDYPHHVTPSEWAAVGSPSPQRMNIGFIKTASNDNIYQCTATPGNPPYLVSFASWQSWGYPTPVIVGAITGKCP